MPIACARLGDLVRRQAFLLMRDRHGDKAARQPGKMPQETRMILGREHADDQHQRPRHPLLEIGERRGDRAAAVGIVAAVEPELAAGRQQRGQLALRQALHARRPFRLEQPGFESAGGSLQRRRRAQGRDRDAGIVELMPPVKPRRRQVEQPVVVLIDQPAALLARGPVLRRQS